MLSTWCETYSLLRYAVELQDMDNALRQRQHSESH